MAQQPHNEEQGPLMLAATDVLKPPPARIAKLGAGITLPRTVPVRSVAAAAAGAVTSLPFGLIAASLFGIQWIVFFVLVFGVLAVALMEWEPQKGETLLRILGVRARTRARQQKVMVNGEALSVSIGVARLDRMATGAAHIVPGAVEVAPGSVDERGVKRTERNRNLVASYAAFPAAGTGPATGSRLDLPEVPTDAHMPPEGPRPVSVTDAGVAGASGHPAPGHPAPGHPAPGHPAPGHPAPGHPEPGGSPRRSRLTLPD